MMLRYSFGMAAEADDIVRAVDEVLEAGCRTADLAHGAPSISTEEMTDAILARL
jgi:3-isopropylmalate dehydrogenase